MATPEARARLLGWLAAVGGIIGVLAQVPLLEPRVERFETTFLPYDVRIASHVASLIIYMVLIAVATQLRHRKRLAWQIAITVFAIAAVLNFFRNPTALAYTGTMTVLLWAGRDDFQAPVDPPSLLRLVRAIPVYLGIVFVFGILALWLQRGRISPQFTLVRSVRTVLLGLVGLDGDYEYRSRAFARFFPAALLALGVLGLIWLVVLLFRPFVGRRPHTAEDWRLARRIVTEHGSDTLSFFALRKDKSFFFSSSGDAMLAYVYLGGYGLVSGDPIGAPGAVDRLLSEWFAFCDTRAWRTAFLAVREDDSERYRELGFRTFYLGDEAIIRCDEFKLEGKRNKGVRQACTRAAREYRFEMLRECDASPQLIGALNAISEKWRGKAPERGFTMALSEDVRGASEEFLLCVALDEHDRPGGFLRIVPVYGGDPGYTLDLMRRDPDTPNGMTEYLVAQTALALKDRGVNRLSMNFAVWGRLFSDDIGFSWIQRVERRVISLLNPFFQIKSLHDFNVKFHPEWLARVLVYRTSADLPRVALLYLGAEGFVTLPGVGPLLVPPVLGGVPGPAESPHPSTL
ncbi:MAG: bifunctional lysylphosphatidylglycerol flippase/synthetase MprF [Acidimicrobiia bacterium]